MNSEAGKCRFCNVAPLFSFVDLGMSPLSNSYLKADDLQHMEAFYPLHAQVCPACHLVQLPEFQTPQQIFSDYAYFSSYSASWLDHCRRFSEDAIERFQLGPKSLVVEVASNDGYLLQFFEQRKVPVLGVEPALNVAMVAQMAGIPTITKFFGAQTARELAQSYPQADLMIGNNVLAHVPDLNDFVSGFKIQLKAEGVISLEFPHLLRLITRNQFDTIYHEHFSYLSLMTVQKIFAAHGLTVFDVDEIETHGGSLRVFARHQENETLPVTERVRDLLKREREAGLDGMEAYQAFADRVRETRLKLLNFLMEVRRAGQKIAGYGAPAKGNTLLNYCGIRSDLLPYTVDISPHKQGLFLPGTHIPIFHPDRVLEEKPDFLLILPWNIQDEIVEQMAAVREWGGKFVVPIPEVRVLP